MGKNISEDHENGFVRGPQRCRVEREKIAKEAYQAARNLGYHLGYNLGFESGYEKGFVEGSTLGHNNGFLAALRLGEGGELPCSDKIPEIQACRILQKLIAGGMAKVFLAGCAAGEAETLFRLLDIETAVLKGGIET